MVESTNYVLMSFKGAISSKDGEIIRYRSAIHSQTTTGNGTLLVIHARITMAVLVRILERN